MLSLNLQSANSISRDGIQLTQCAPEMANQEFTAGQFDAFFYPSDRDGPEDVIERPPPIESVEYDAACPCPSHCDPGIFTLVAETESALEARAQAVAPPASSQGEAKPSTRESEHSWQRLHLRSNELCVVTGQQLAKLTSGRIAASPHRVALTEAARASFVFEVHTAGSLDPAEETAVEQAGQLDGPYAPVDATLQFSDGKGTQAYTYRRSNRWTGRSRARGQRMVMVRTWARMPWSWLSRLG